MPHSRSQTIWFCRWRAGLWPWIYSSICGLCRCVPPQSLPVVSPALQICFRWPGQLFVLGLSHLIVLRAILSSRCGWVLHGWLSLHSAIRLFFQRAVLMPAFFVLRAQHFVLSGLGAHRVVPWSHLAPHGCSCQPLSCTTCWGFSTRIPTSSQWLLRQLVSCTGRPFPLVLVSFLGAAGLARPL